MPVVVAVPVVMAGGGHLVGLEQPDAQQQRQGHIAFDRMKNARVVLHLSQCFFHLLQALFRHEIAFVQQQDVAVDHLSPAHLCVEHGCIEVLGIDQGDDRIQAGGVPQLTAQEGHGHR